MCQQALGAYWHISKKRRAHRYNHIPLLHFCPGGVLQELIARRAAKVYRLAEIKKEMPKI